MKLLVALAAVTMVAGAFAERCGCNKPNINKPKQTVAVQKPAATPRQCAQAKPCAQRPVAK